MAFVWVVLKAIVEVGGLSLVAQFLVGIFAWGRREQNPIYKLFGVIASPFTRLARFITPKAVLDRHVPLVAFLLLFFAWILLIVQINVECRQDPMQRGCPPELRAK